MTNDGIATAEVREACTTVLDLIEQYTRPDFYMWLFHDHAGQKSDPCKRAAEAKKLLTELLNSKPSNRAAAAAAPQQSDNESCSHWREGDSDHCVWCGDDLGPTTDADVCVTAPVEQSDVSQSCQRCGKLGGKIVNFNYDSITTSRWICPHCLDADEGAR